MQLTRHNTCREIVATGDGGSYCHTMHGACRKIVGTGDVGLHRHAMRGAWQRRGAWLRSMAAWLPTTTHCLSASDPTMVPKIMEDPKPAMKSRPMSLTSKP